ncbi:MAG: NUDIX domain-containing protein [Actinomycetia bacterium]|nr:NUDIX domain-containing protein [Actinomycetes bacterium]MCP5030880.1 NUDIX domain-containing protein [Actinomycetes bacterium]
MTNQPSHRELLRWSEALAGLARTGLGFTDSRFEAERYEEVLAIAADIRASMFADHTATDHTATDHMTAARDEWLRLVGSGVAGYVTPKVAIGAVVGNDDGRLLLIQRADSGVWLYPTGWADVGYSASEVAEKEVLEETGIRCEVVRPLAIIDGMRAGWSRIPLYSIVFYCRAVGGVLAHHPQECLDAGWFDRHNMPEPLANGDSWQDLAFGAIDGDGVVDLIFDLPRQPVWRQPPKSG